MLQSKKNTMQLHEILMRLLTLNILQYECIVTFLCKLEGKDNRYKVLVGSFTSLYLA